MLKKYLTVLVWVFLVFPFFLSAAEYTHRIEAENMEFAWILERDRIHIRLSGKTTGWVGIGFSPEDKMKGGNIIIGFVKKGRLKIEDHYGNRHKGHLSDRRMGGRNNVLNPSGSEENGVTTIMFTLALDTDEKFDKPINPEGTSSVMLAYGAGRDSFNTLHKFRAVYEVNYSTGENKIIN